MKAIIFDMDGVIIDSEYAYTKSIKSILNGLGHEVTEDYIYTFTGTTHEFTWNQIKSDYALDKPITNYIKDMFERRERIIDQDGIIANKNIKEFVIDAHNKGYKLAVASSSPLSEIHRTVKELEIETYFDHLVSGEQVEHSKPAPDVFLLTAELLEVEPNDCIVIEDSQNGSIAAKAAGMYCIGYRDRQYPEQDLILTDEIVYDFLDIELKQIKETDKMKKIIFDMDGVIVDSEYTYLESKTQILNEAGYDKPISYQYQFMGTTYEFMWQVMKDELGLPKDIQHYISEMNRIREEMIERDGVRAIKNAQQLIHKLVEEGYELAVASSSPKKEIVRNLTELGLMDYFKVLVSGEEVARSKPNPDVFLRAAELLEIDPADCIVIEDTKNGARAAKAANMYCYGFANPDYPAQDLSVTDEIVTDLLAINIGD